MFQYFGGKSRVAQVVWDRLGNVDNYTEPFFGSGAMLLRRPPAHFDGERRETVNDYDGYVANFWRAVKAAPDDVAQFADWPCNENDLTARHIWLVNAGDSLRERLEGNPDFYDAKIAGWWAWGLTWWIGSGWCSNDGAWTTDGERIVKKVDGRGVSRKLPSLDNNGRGVSRKLPNLGNNGRGWCADYSTFVCETIRAVSGRIRRVRVCCGDWARVLTPSAAGYSPTCSNIVGIFLDPPYGSDRADGCYSTDSFTVAADVLEWCKAHGNDKRLRICLAGHDGEHNALEDMGWSVVAWKAAGMACIAKGNSRGKKNNAAERLWFSPYCLTAEESVESNRLLQEAAKARAIQRRKTLVRLSTLA